MKTIFLTILLAGLLFATDSHADKKDQTLTIMLNAAGCVDQIKPPADDNCKTNNSGQRAGCGNSKDCVCGARDKHIVWQTDPKKAYSIRFYDQSPFQPGCRLQANQNGKVQCLITSDASGEYDYGVTVEGCEEYDPRIVIRAN